MNIIICQTQAKCQIKIKSWFKIRTSYINQNQKHHLKLTERWISIKLKGSSRISMKLKIRGIIMCKLPKTTSSLLVTNQTDQTAHSTSTPSNLWIKQRRVSAQLGSRQTFLICSWQRIDQRSSGRDSNRDQRKRHMVDFKVTYEKNIV